ncbi:methyltransferase [Bordetella ansorpii]|uniref:Methyltransferase n=1 Tax=Bordetella ansorpii TaxID=288768 RepID=A0A157Q6J2_9BORD|nr:SAM-dependent methyltransferase [Bordetella ansorpii]SAI41503.1 methyltransferase [Bordetella ansorpii]
MSSDTHEIRPGQSIELLKALHILTRDGKMNQDSRRKLKQVYHLFQFIEPLLKEVKDAQGTVSLVDHGAGKSYLGFILYDLFFKDLKDDSHIYGIETRDELVQRSRELAHRLGFGGMSFLNLSVADSIESKALPVRIDVVTALHACDTATDDALRFALKKQARHIVVVPCCQAEVAGVLRRHKQTALADPLAEIWRHPLHTREFGSQITNVLRCLQLEAHGYQVSVTELVGWEHSMKNELIVAQYKADRPRRKPAERLAEILDRIGLQELKDRFFVPQAADKAA